MDKNKLDFENSALDCLHYFTKNPDEIEWLSKIEPQRIISEIKVKQLDEVIKWHGLIYIERCIV